MPTHWMSFFPFQKLVSQTESITYRHRVFDLDFVDEYHNSAKNKHIWRRFLENSPDEHDIWKFSITHPIPTQYRARIWRNMPMHHSSGSKPQKSISPKTALSIRTDVARTPWLILPSDFRTIENVLIDFARKNPRVGYFQGLNLLATVPTLVGFNGLETSDLLNNFFRDDCQQDTPDSLSVFCSQVDCTVFVLRESLPVIYEKFQSVGVDLTLLAFDAYLSLFTSVMPLFAVLRVWDFLLLSPEGAVRLDRSTPNAAVVSCLFAFISCIFLPVVEQQKTSVLSVYFMKLKTVSDSDIQEILLTAKEYMDLVRNALIKMVSLKAQLI